MFYATFNAADSKALTDAFKQLYPKIDAAFYRATDAQLMERILTESRAGQNSLGCDGDDEFLRPQYEKAGHVRGLRFAGAKIFSPGLQG